MGLGPDQWELRGRFDGSWLSWNTLKINTMLEIQVIRSELADFARDVTETPNKTFGKYELCNRAPSSDWPCSNIRISKKLLDGVISVEKRVQDSWSSEILNFKQKLSKMAIIEVNLSLHCWIFKTKVYF